MSPETFFLVISGLAGIGWFCLIVLSRYFPAVDKFIIGVVVVLIALIYVYLNFSHLGDAGGLTSFLTYNGIMKVFTIPALIVAGWAHILAVDLLLGVWIKNNAQKNNINYGLVVVLLLITIMFAPLGFILYLLVRWIKIGSYFGSFV
jgi:hypothetical protein